ncbi:MAG TPA: TolC family protein [Terriglobales bacterium]|nr:TolC family protein [Terriglobales bacterium]
MIRRAIIALSLCVSAAAQTFPSPRYFRHFFVKPAQQRQLVGPGGLEQYVTDGKLRLSLSDAVRLTLENNTDVRINELQTETARFSLQKAFGPFDPILTSNFQPTRSVSPANSTLQGASTPSNLTQQWTSSYSQLFASGTLYQVSLSANRNASNSSFAIFNPSISSSLSVSLTQPLLRNRGLFPNRAPILIAQRNLKQSRADFAGRVNDSLLSAVNQYWDVVQARESLIVLRQSQTLAEASYNHDKRALELGAISPLDIYRSEAQVAQRKLQVIQAEYQLKQSEDAFRRTIGADLDPKIAVLDLDLTEPSDMSGEGVSTTIEDALAQAMKDRPEFESLQQQLANDETNIKLADNGLKPDLNLSTFYSMNGQGGNLIDSSTGVPIVVSRGGLGDSFDQLTSRDFPTYGATLQFRLPLRNRSAEADLGTSLVAQKRDLYRLRQQQQAISLEVKNAVHQLEQAKLSVAAARISRDLAQKTLQAEQRKYELGTETIFFVLDAQNQLAQAEQNLVQAQISYQRAVTALDHATGALIAKNNVQITNP